jgi:hypothetical protein
MLMISTRKPRIRAEGLKAGMEDVGRKNLNN